MLESNLQGIKKEDILLQEETLDAVLRTKVSLNEIAKYRTQFLTVRRWFEKLEEDRPLPLDNNSNTVRHYLSYLMKFCKWIGKDPDEIIRERLDDRDSDDIETVERYDRLVRLFSRGYKKRQKPVAAREAVVALKSFFTKNSASLSVKSPRKIVEKERNRLLINEIKELLRFCDAREKAFVLLELQTGARPLSLLSLKYGDIKADFESKNLPVRVHFRIFNVKGQYAPYTTFFGLDTYKALQDYLKLRELDGEKIDDQSPLMRKAKTHAPETYAGLSKMCAKLTRLAHMLKINKQITPGTFRRTFQTIMEQHLPVNWVDRLMGHVRFRGIQGDAYSQPTIEDLIEAYKKAEPHISVSETKVDTSHVGIEVLNSLAKIFGVDLNKIIQREKIVSLDEMTEDDINLLYDEFRKLIAFEKTVSVKPEKDSKNCDQVSVAYKFKIIGNEEDLISLLENGWKFEKELSKGRYLLKKAV
jgi:integrase